MAAYLDDDPPGFDDVTEEPDPEGPSRADIERFADECRRCPACDHDVYEDAQLCQVCGHAFEDRPGKPAPWVLIVSAVLLLALLALFVF